MLNKFGVVVSRGTMSRCIVAAAENLSEDKIKLQVHENHQSFKVATVDNVDQNVKSGEIVFGKKVENMHDTTIQSVEPGPTLFINTASDYCSFLRQIKDITCPSLKQVNVIWDGRCLFRCIATLLYMPLLLCERNEGGMPRVPGLENLETNLTDILRADTVNILKANLQILNDMDDAILMAFCEKQNGQFYDSLEYRLISMESHDEYAGENEINWSCSFFLLSYISVPTAEWYSCMLQPVW